jgi:hypothetical protein
MSIQGQKLRKTTMGKYEQRVTYSKLSAVVAMANFQQKKIIVKKGLLISKQN